MDFGLISVALLLALALTLTFFAEPLLRRSKTAERRPLPPLAQIDRALSRAAETGLPIHLTPGVGPLSGRSIGAETFAGLLLAQRVADLAARRGARVVASTGDAIAQMALLGALRRAYHDAGNIEEFDPRTIRLYAHDDPLAFAAGLGGRYGEERHEASVAVGAFGPSYLLIGAQGQRQGLSQIAGTANPESLAAMVLTSGATLLGEDVYAAEAYLTPTPAGRARLLTHDTLRSVIIMLMLIGLAVAGLREAEIINLPIDL